MLTKKNTNIIYFLLFVSFFFTHFHQLQHQHWSGVLDQDLVIIYNSILLNSGLEQEFREHPAFTTFIINSLIYKILNIFSKIPYEINSILNANNIDEIFQYYFYISRTVNFFCNVLLIFFFNKILKKLKLKKEIRFLICLIFITSIGYISSFFFIRSENISLLFLIFSINAVLIENKKKLLNFFIAGIFLSLAMLAKIQIIFLALFIVYLIVNIERNNKYNIINNVYIKNYLLLSLLVGFFSYFSFQVYIQEFPRFQSRKYLDLVFFSISFFVLIFYFYFSKNFKENLLIFSSIINGISFFIFLIFFFDKINLLKVNDFIFLRITNPLHYMSEYADTNKTARSINFDYIKIYVSQFFSDYKFSKIELLLFIGLILANLKNKIINFVIILIFIVNTLIINFRYAEYYYIYYIFIYLILFSEMVKKLDSKLSIRFTCVALIIFSINNINFLFFKKNFFNEIFHRENNMLKVCNEYKLGNKKSWEYIKYWHNKIDDKKIKKICNEIF